jgi:hypothetical protein
MASFSAQLRDTKAPPFILHLQRICPRRHPPFNDFTYTPGMRKPGTGRQLLNTALKYANKRRDAVV